MVFDEEIEAFQAYAESLPNNCIFLVDTYDTIEGVHKAIEVGRWLRSKGKKLLGIRLDSGDLAYLSIRCRELLDEAGFTDTKIVASNELDETLISDLKRQGAQISVWGVGTNLVTSRDQPALDGVYKLSAIRDPGKQWINKIKLSEQMIKISNPGILQVRRFSTPKGNIADVLYDVHTDISKGCTIVDPLDPTHKKVLSNLSMLNSHDLLVPVFRQGKRVYELPTLKECRQRTHDELAGFQVGIKRFINPHQYIVGMEKSLYDLKVDLINIIRSKTETSALSHGDIQ
jgi:nicotinate phosphoribosyltransferase